MRRDTPEFDAAGEYFMDDMECCPRCGEYVPWDHLEALIGTPPICFVCRVRVQESRLEDYQLPNLLGLS
jgi:hypothetical protein